MTEPREPLPLGPFLRGDFDDMTAGELRARFAGPLPLRFCACRCSCADVLEDDDLVRCKDCVDGFHSWNVPTLPSKRVDRFAFIAGVVIVTLAAIYFTAHVLAAYVLCPGGQ